MEEDVLEPDGVEEKAKQESLLSAISATNLGIIRMNVPIGEMQIQILLNLMTLKICCLWLKKR